MFSEDVINSFPSYGVCDELDCVPSLQEVRDTLSLIAGGKAGGSSSILPEMVKVCCDELLGYLVQLFGSVWESKAVPQGWCDASLVSVPKKGDLSLCDNWRGISLLDVVGKVFAKIIQQRTGSCGGGCSRLSVWLSVQSWLHRHNFLCLPASRKSQTQRLFYLKKAYDSVPRDAIWLIPTKYRVPDALISPCMRICK